MKCPTCNGTGCIASNHYKRILKADSRKRIAKRLRENGYSYREICRVVGWKSPRTAMVICNKPQ